MSLFETDLSAVSPALLRAFENIEAGIRLPRDNARLLGLVPDAHAWEQGTLKLIRAIDT